MKFLALLFVAAAGAATPSPASTAMPPEITSLAAGIRAEKEHSKRIELLTGLMNEVKKRISELPEDIDEAELPRVQMLYELNVLFGSLRPETMNPATCPKVLRTMEEMVNPRGSDAFGASATGRLAIDVVKSVCAP